MGSAALAAASTRLHPAASTPAAFSRKICLRDFTAALQLTYIPRPPPPMSPTVMAELAWEPSAVEALMIEKAAAFLTSARREMDSDMLPKAYRIRNGFSRACLAVSRPPSLRSGFDRIANPGCEPGAPQFDTRPIAEASPSSSSQEAHPA